MKTQNEENAFEGKQKKSRNPRPSVHFVDFTRVEDIGAMPEQTRFEHETRKEIVAQSNTPADDLMAGEDGLRSHSLIRSGIFLPGRLGLGGGGVHEANLPLLTITKYGKSVIRKGENVPFDPLGYVELLKKRLPNIDSIILYYITESMRAFSDTLLISATLTLGIASERFIILLGESLIKFLGEQKSKKLSKELEQSIFRFHKTLMNELNCMRKEMPREIFENIDIYLEQFFQFIRLNRNDKGHPKKLDLSRSAVYAMLQMFIEYSEKIYRIISYFQQQPKELTP